MYTEQSENGNDGSEWRSERGRRREEKREVRWDTLNSLFGLLEGAGVAGEAVGAELEAVVEVEAAAAAAAAAAAFFFVFENGLEKRKMRTLLSSASYFCMLAGIRFGKFFSPLPFISSSPLTFTAKI